MRFIIYFIACIALALSSCKNENNPSQSEKVRNMIAASKLAQDAHSYSRPNEIRVKHLTWNARVDFDKKIIEATAIYELQHLAPADEVVLDVKALNITSVQVDDIEVKYAVSEEKPFIGASLTIPVKRDSKQIAISYNTTEGAEALLWMEGEQPFLFTQSQAVLARTWIPCQDSPGVRITYDATVKVSPGLMALMSATNPTEKTVDGVYHFKMDQPISTYLMALAVGDVSFRSLGNRTGVYATKDLIDVSAKEFEDMQAMLEAAEKLYGPYAWGRYDVLVLPAAFPFGGMENPRLTFVTPTILAGDKSLVSLIAHELAHSWSGNLVTNSTWDDFWLNEGFTVYFEERIMEEVYGREYSEMLALLNKQDLERSVEEISAINADDTKLKLTLVNRNPDDGMTDIAYNKGYFFLRLCEEQVGREKWDDFLKKYFSEHAFQVMDTERFLDYLRKNLASERIEEKVNIEEWVYKPGIPSNIPIVNSNRMELAKSSATKFAQNGDTKAIRWSEWSYQEKVAFLTNMPAPNLMQIKQLDKSFSISSTKNNEVLFAWLDLAIITEYKEAYPQLEEFLIRVGRRKFVAPLYERLISTNQKDIAKEIYQKARPNYHSVTINTIDEMIK